MLVETNDCKKYEPAPESGGVVLSVTPYVYRSRHQRGYTDSS
jgi:hypothetical protein